MLGIKSRQNSKIALPLMRIQISMADKRKAAGPTEEIFRMNKSESVEHLCPVLSYKKLQFRL